MNSAQLRADEDRRRMELLGGEIPQVGSIDPLQAQPTLQSPVQPAPSMPEPEPVAPPELMPAPAPVDPAQSKDAALYQHLKAGAEPAMRPEDPWARVQESLYAAGSPGGKLAQSFFERPEQTRMAQAALLKKDKSALGLTPDDIAAQNAALVDPALSAALGGEANIRNMTAESIIKHRGGHLKGVAIGNQAGQFDQSFGLKERDAALKAQKFEHDKQIDAIRNEHMASKIQLAQKSQESVQQRYGTTALQNYTKMVAKDVPAVAIMEEIEAMIPGVTRGAAPPGMMASEWEKAKAQLPFGLGTQINDQQKNQLLSATKMLNMFFIRPIAGATFTPQEQTEFQKILNDAVGSTPEAQAAAIDLVRKAVFQKIRNAEAGYGPSVPEELWSQFAGDGGVTTRKPLFSDLREAGGTTTQSMDPNGQGMNMSPQDAVRAGGDLLQQGAKTGRQAVGAGVKAAKEFVVPARKVMVTDGNETLEIDEADLADAEADGFSRVQ